MDNLIGKPAHSGLQARLDDLTMEWFLRTGDDWRERADRPFR